MTGISEPKIQKLEIDRIEATERLRPVSEAGVESLIASINELGVIKDAIHVRKKGRGDKEVLVLMAGAHRLEAAKRLGWEKIPARIWADVNDNWAQIMEIDDNLAGADLSALELSVFLAERKRVYERIYPDAKHGAHGGRGGKRNEKDIMSFSKSVAEKREMSTKHISRFVAIGNALSPHDIAQLTSSEHPIKMKDLMALAKISAPIVRADVVGKLASGAVRSVADALADLEPGESKPAPDPIDEAYQKLLTLWKRSPMPAKRRFVDDLETELASVMNAKPQIKAV
ncbi:ParB N-terminal domain-containing protein [Thalassobius sp. I31.1]|uniref:ParB/RepB/Spo0J family partition protein n=1 Tax=Thalassobius sp. I31.1 TaxID=2109912 RepID=UPI000D1BAB44|nr:ParB N-terminal domain-containing protein [Thalassobius sp. I31.1]